MKMSVNVQIYMYKCKEIKIQTIYWIFSRTLVHVLTMRERKTLRVDELRRQRFDDELVRGKSLGLDLLEIDFANPLETKMHVLWTKDVSQ